MKQGGFSRFVKQLFDVFECWNGAEVDIMVVWEDDDHEEVVATTRTRTTLHLKSPLGATLFSHGFSCKAEAYMDARIKVY